MRPLLRTGTSVPCGRSGQSFFWASQRYAIICAGSCLRTIVIPNLWTLIISPSDNNLSLNRAAICFHWALPLLRIHLENFCSLLWMLYVCSMKPFSSLHHFLPHYIWLSSFFFFPSLFSTIFLDMVSPYSPPWPETYSNFQARVGWVDWCDLEKERRGEVACEQRKIVCIDPHYAHFREMRTVRWMDRRQYVNWGRGGHL